MGQETPIRALNRKSSSLCPTLKGVRAKEMEGDGSLDKRDLACVDVQERLMRGGEITFFTVFLLLP